MFYAPPRQGRKEEIVELLKTNQFYGRGVLGLFDSKIWLIKDNVVPEAQDLECKFVWKDEDLKWICGFDNAQGARKIGKYDNGNVVGMKNAQKLLEYLPNQTSSSLIVAAISLQKTQ